MLVVAHALHDAERLGQFERLLVGSLAGGQRLEHIGDRHDPRRHRHLFAGQPAREAAPVHTLMVAAGVFRHPAQLARERQGFEHLQGNVHVPVDNAALLFGEGAARNAEVVDLVLG